MWSPVVSPPDVPEDKIPVSRCKHATVLHGQCLYLLGGRNGNLPMKDFWKYCIGKIFAQYWFYVCRFNIWHLVYRFHSIEMYLFYFLADNKWYQLDTKGAKDFPGCLQVSIVNLTTKNAAHSKFSFKVFSH